ncbi:Beta,beta-carotene 9',10'-oxygenase [Orchesella cincta]|uniref:Beta,beta-carotene 9',10'-oxygenase n=1 Tax=Orchesella cincta TaxID=48709 RepID=A0A1D2MP52_ORCCI|nr:Beta,beta-carotene 9',10'-oxygenase [Orchesella cincta]
MSQQQKDVSRLFVSAEETKEPEEVPWNGEIPKWLKGRIYQTGPGLLDLPNFTMNDYLDGYAILSKFEIDALSVKLTKKYPKTESYEKALEKGKPYFMEYGTTAKREGSKANIFSKLVTTFSRDDMSDNCSASIYQCGRHLIASSPTTFFNRINSETLCSEERFDAKKYLGQNGYGVHPLVDEETGTMWNMGFTVLPTVKYNIVKIPGTSSKDMTMDALLSKGSTVASISPRWNGALSFNHSFGMTKNYIVFIEQPYVVKISRVLAATIKDYAVKDWLEWRGSDKNRFLIIEKSTGKVFSTEYMSADSFFFLHVINCYENEDSQIIVDIATSKTPSSTGATTLGKLRSNIIDEVDTSTVERFIIPIIENVKGVPENSNLIPNTRAEATRKGNTIILKPDVIFSRSAERAVINAKFIGKKYSFLYASGSFLSVPSADAAMAHSICKINVDTKEVKTWTASDDHFPGESIFIPRQSEIADEGLKVEEDAGIIVSAISSSNANAKDFLVILDGESLKEMARAEFSSQIPTGLHGVFIHK